jgi:hypothetical protein
MAAYVSALNQQAIVRDYAVQFVSNLSITNINSIILQASTLSSLTDATEELTRQTVVCISFSSIICLNLIFRHRLQKNVVI